MNTPRSAPKPARFRSASNELKLAPEGVPARAHVEHAEVLAIEQDEAGAGTQDRLARAGEVPQRLGEALPLDPERHRRRLAARDHERVETLELLRRPHGPRLRPQLTERSRVCLEVALEGEHPDER